MSVVGGGVNLSEFLSDLADEPDWQSVGEVGIMTRGVSGDTPLHAALWAGDDEAASSLVAAGADANAKGEEGYTPLHVAIAQQNTAMARLLLSRGASWDIRSDLGSTPLEDAARSSHPGVRALSQDGPEGCL
jgi:ankyrin repeat protein